MPLTPYKIILRDNAGNVQQHTARAVNQDAAMSVAQSKAAELNRRTSTFWQVVRCIQPE